MDTETSANHVADATERPPAGDDLATSEHRLRLAMHAFSGAPQAQRRWVQMGVMQRARDILDSDGDRIGELHRQGAIDDELAQMLENAYQRYLALKAGHEDLLEERISRPRSFLWSTALQGEDWTAMRRAARPCLTALSVGKEPLIG